MKGGVRDLRPYNVAITKYHVDPARQRRVPDRFRGFEETDPGAPPCSKLSAWFRLSIPVLI